MAYVLDYIINLSWCNFVGPLIRSQVEL